MHGLLKTLTWSIHEETEVNFTDHLAGLSAVRPPIINDNKPPETSLFATQTSSLFRLKLSADLLPILIYRSEIWTLRRQDNKLLTSFEITFYRRTPCTHFWPPKELRNFGRVETRTRFRQSKKIQSKMTTTCNKNEHQENAKNNAVL